MLGAGEFSDTWQSLPQWLQSSVTWVVQIGLPIAFGVWATLRYRDWRLSRPHEMPLKVVIDEAWNRLAARGQSETLAEWGDMHVAQEIREMASRGDIKIWGKQQHWRGREIIPNDFWLECQISGISLTQPDNEEICTESAGPIHARTTFFDMTMTTGDANKIFERAKRDPKFGKNEPYAECF